MDNLVITSSGFNTAKNYVPDENIEYFKKIAKNNKIIIVANAAPNTSGNYVARTNVRDNFLKVGAKQADIVDLNETNIDQIFNYDIVYVLGGDLRYLIELNQHTDIAEKLKNSSKQASTLAKAPAL